MVVVLANGKKLRLKKHTAELRREQIIQDMLDHGYRPYDGRKGQGK